MVLFVEFAFYFDVFSFDRTFKLKPTHGILKDFQLVVFEMIPRDAKLYSSIIKCQLNSTASVNFKVKTIIIVIITNIVFLL